MLRIKTALFFVGGPQHLPPDIYDRIEVADLVICTDGGAESCAALSLMPDVLVGDMDSISQDLLEAFRQAGVEIRRYPTHKDATDLELALEYAHGSGLATVWLVNSLGGRWDMSLANILLTARAEYREMSLCHLGNDCIMHILHPGCMVITADSGTQISLLPLGGDVRGVTLHGFEYPLQEAELCFGTTRGVSNIVAEDSARIEHTEGVLLCIEQPGISE